MDLHDAYEEMLNGEPLEPSLLTAEDEIDVLLALWAVHGDATPKDLALSADLPVDDVVGAHLVLQGHGFVAPVRDSDLWGITETGWRECYPHMRVRAGRDPFRGGNANGLRT